MKQIQKLKSFLPWRAVKSLHGNKLISFGKLKTAPQACFSKGLVNAMEKQSPRDFCKNGVCKNNLKVYLKSDSDTGVLLLILRNL